MPIMEFDSEEVTRWREERDAAVIALREIEAHHKALNEQVGRAVTRSNTLRLVKQGLNGAGEKTDW